MLYFFGLISGVLSIIGGAPYVYDILKKTTKPERATWFIWSILGSIAFFSQFAKGATDSLWLTGAQTIIVLIIFLLSLKFGVGGFNRMDIAALIFAGIALILWYLTNEATVALFLVILIDAIGGMPTIIKSYEAPESESLISWLLFGISGIFAMVAVGSFNFILLSYPAYIFLFNVGVVAAILLGRKRNRVIKVNSPS